ncbi:MAG: magnesium transporter [Verrucomicrobiales bacterium]
MSGLSTQAEPRRVIAALLERGDKDKLATYLDRLPPAEVAHALLRLPEDDRGRLLELLDPEDAADVLHDLPYEEAIARLEDLDAEDAAAIVSEFAGTERAQYLAELEDEDAEPILAALPADEAAAARAQMRYEENSAGYLMDAAFLAYPEGKTVGEILADMRANAERYAEFDVQYAYVLSAGGALRGVLRLRDLVLRPRATPAAEIMLPNPVSVRADAPLDTLTQLFDHHSYIGVPVVDADGHAVGVLRRRAVAEAAEERAEGAFMKLSGIVGGEELRSMPMLQRSLRRLAWLGPNIVLNMIAASVIAAFQGTLEAVIALAVFLPIVSDMSGCSGNQAVAVSIRELTLGVLKPTEFLRVFFKEGGLGILNGTILGALLGAVAWLWKGNLWLGAVVGGALALNTVLSVLLGGLVPLVLRRFKVDPALASGPILTTCTDMCGFFLVLGLASAVLSRISL